MQFEVHSRMARANMCRISASFGALPSTMTSAPSSAARALAYSIASSGSSMLLALQSSSMVLSHASALSRMASMLSPCLNARRAESMVWPMSSCTRSFMARVSSSRTISGILSYSRFNLRLASSRRAFSFLSSCWRVTSLVTSEAVTSV